MQRNISVTVPKPSLVLFEQLQAKYPDTLSCPCRQVAVSYSSFLSITATYHQICSSEFISSQWIASLFDLETSRITPLDFRLTAAVQFRLLSLFCTSSMSMINEIRNDFINGKVVNVQLLSHVSFDTQIKSIVDKFYATLSMSITPSNAADMIMLTIINSGIQSAIHNNGFTLSIPGSNQYQTVPNFYPRYSNATFTNNLQDNFAFCDAFSVVTYQAGIYAWGADQRSLIGMMTPQPPAIFHVNGMHVGCEPFHSIKESTLECFFDPICLNITTQLISNLPINDWPKPLNSSLSSRFLRNSKISLIFENLMVEQWITVKNFSKYYNACEPLQCTYTFTQRNDFIYVITLLIGLYGGLTVVLRILAPFIVKFGHNIYAYLTKKNDLQRQPQPQQTQSETWYTRIIRILTLIKQNVVSLNLFEHDLSDQRTGIRATRVHVVLVIMSVIILAFYSSLTVHTRTVTVLAPSSNTFERLHNDYSVTLSCPCSQVSTPNAEMITISSPRYHQICTSMFLEPVWFDGYFTIRFANSSETYSLPLTDMRMNGIYSFGNYLTICQLSNDTVAKATAVFMKDEFVTAQALSRVDEGLEFKARLEPLISTFKTRTTQIFAMLLALMRIFLAGSGVESGMAYQPLMINSTPSIRRYSPAPANLSTCACSVSLDCPGPAGFFFCVKGNNCPAGTSVWATPGIRSSCLRLGGMLNTELRCFFDQTCLDMIRSLYNVDLPTRLPLPVATLAVPVLNNSVPSRFSANDSFGTILNQLMVDTWDIEGNFEDYYKICAPAVCTYTYSQRLDIFYVVATIAGLIGGLLVIFRLIIPMGARFIHWLFVYCRKRHVDNIEEQSDQQHPTEHIPFNIKQKLVTMNLFKKESSISQIENVNEVAIIATRFYLILLIESPSVATFEQLHNAYATTISCLCQQIAIPYGTFLLVSPSFHQICTSDFVKTLWTTSLYGYGSTVNSYAQLDRPVLSRQHQLMGWLCSEIQIIVDHAISNFNQTMLVTSMAISRASFVSQTAEIIRQLTEQTPINFRRLFTLIIEVSAGAVIPSFFNTDWSLEYGNLSNDYLLRSLPRKFINSTCNCVVSNACNDSMRIGPSELVLPGLVVGCWPIHGLRMSTLECFFSQSCVNTIINYLDYFTQMDGSPPVNFTLPSIPSLVINPLNKTISSRFTPNTAIGTLIDEIFIEQWTSASIYENYYATCRPSVCRYEYVQQNDGLYVVTSLLSVYGGLTVGLKFLVWNVMLLYRAIKSYIQTRRTAVQPWIAQN
ncbi:hypothetical protein I4U23_027472 [Adineta vaga]|nr:hypothetical protein I4U23_027472 [Adineta vaga]